MRNNIRMLKTESPVLFISQLKSNNMGARTIDEGRIDEKRDMNFSEYVATLFLSVCENIDNKQNIENITSL